MTPLDKLVPAQEELLYALHGLVENRERECARRALRVLVVTGDYRAAVTSIVDWELATDGR